MAGNDVRIRLSAEGIAEVTAALRKVQTQANRANRQAEVGFASVRKSLIGLRGLIGGIGISAATIGLSGLGRAALDFADAVSKTSQRTGLATEQISALAVAGRLAGIELPAIQVGLSRLPQTLDDIRKGTGDAARATAELGLSLADFDGLDLGQSLELLGQRLSEFPAGTDKVRIAVDLFGKSGLNLILLLDQLGREGFAGLIKTAEGMGVLVSKEFGVAAEATNDAVTAMQFELQGLSAQFLQGFLPSVLSTFGTFDDTVKDDGVNSLKEFGEGFGRVFRIAAAVLQGIAGLARDTVAIITGNFSTLFDVVNRVVAGDFPGAFERIKNLAGDIADRFVTLGKNAIAAGKKVSSAFTDPPRAPNRAGGAGAGATGDGDGEGPPAPAEVEAEAKKREAARLKAIRQGIADEASVRDAGAARQAQADQREFDQGLITLEAYIDRRRKAVAAGLAAETAALQSELAQVQAQTTADAVARASDVASLRAQIQVREIQAAQELDALDAERLDRQRTSATEQLQVAQQLAEIEGRKTDAARLALDLQSQALQQQLTAAGATRTQVDALVARFRSATESRLGFEDIVAQAETAFSTLDAARTRIEQDVELGITTQLGGQSRLLAIEQSRLPVLRALADAMLEAARATGDQDAIDQAEAMSLRVREIAVSVELASNSFARFRDQAEQSAVNALTDFLDTGITQAKNLKDAFRSLAVSVINDLKRIAAQALATSIVRGLSAAFGGGAAGAGGGGGSGGSTFARGGLLRGAGSGTSDSIPAWLSHGEYVVRASSVRRPGMLRMLESINAGDAPGYRAGGLIDVMPRFAAGGLAEAGGSSSFRARLEVGLADGLESRSTPVSDDLIIDVIRRNPRRVGEIIR